MEWLWMRGEYPASLKPGDFCCTFIQGTSAFRATQRAFRNDMNAELERNGGRDSLNFN
jgi:hypothetical protein